MAQPLRSGRDPIGPATAPGSRRGDPGLGRHADGSCPEEVAVSAGTRGGCWTAALGTAVRWGLSSWGRAGGRERHPLPPAVLWGTVLTEGLEVGSPPPSPLSFHCPPGTYTSTNICRTPTRVQALTRHQGCSCEDRARRQQAECGSKNRV